MSFFFFNDTATTEIYTRSIVGSVRCVQETAIYGAGRCFVVRADTEHDLVIYTRARLHNLASDSILQPENGIVKIPLKQSQTLLLLEIQQAYRAVWQSFPECRRKQVSIFITQMTKRQETLCYQCIFRFLCESCLY
eukprot:TRINITY_DN13571_c0_g1_i5.p2 TRINITY_DN13571_c0_g1~~TRINITY_DN13571_c0_g1_i5.p2  ORF type:complete len:136 (-),score=11.76 TRINITY_DN13571_c0_g1_i5:245-652(-)